MYEYNTKLITDTYYWVMVHNRTQKMHKEQLENSSFIKYPIISKVR